MLSFTCVRERVAFRHVRNQHCTLLSTANRNFDGKNSSRAIWSRRAFLFRPTRRTSWSNSLSVQTLSFPKKMANAVAKRTRITSVVSQSGTLIRQSINVQITFDDTCHVVYIVTNNKRLFSFKYVRISVLHYHPTSHTHVRSLIRMYMTERQHSLIKRTFILGIDTHVHDRKRTFSHEMYVHTT